MQPSLRQFIAEHRQPLESALAQALPQSTQRHAARLNEALHYALFPGGKRWRPWLTLLGARACGMACEAALPAACAMEFLHTSSLIIDDLPAMDDAGTRRNRATLHRVYGEDVALLAALTLMNAAYGLLARGARAETAAALIAEATRCIGSDGMIGGQMVDLAAPTGAPDDALFASRNLKTTALLELTLTAGARAGGARASQFQALAAFGAALGTAYQICDDLLDELGESQQLGKPAKQDARHARASCVAEFGLVGAHQQAQQWVASGAETLRQEFGARLAVDWLIEAAQQIVSTVPPPVPVAERWLALTGSTSHQSQPGQVAVRSCAG